MPFSSALKIDDEMNLSTILCTQKYRQPIVTLDDQISYLNLINSINSNSKLLLNYCRTAIKFVCLFPHMYLPIQVPYCR